MSISPVPTGWPRTSTATRFTGSLTSMPDGLMLTSATARSTWSTSDAAPRTCTSSALTIGSPISRPSGTSPGSTSTGTVRISTRSIATRTVAGFTVRTSMPSNSESTVTGSSWGSGARSMSYSDRSTVAANAWSLTVVSTSLDVRYWTSTSPRSPLSTIELSGGFTPTNRTEMSASENWPEKTSPV